MTGKKKVMVLGAGRGQVDLIRAIKRYGYTAIVLSIEGNYPGISEADEIYYVDISDPIAVYEQAKKCGIDAITTACLDTGIPALGYTCEQLNLCGLSEKAAKLSQDKLLMKQAFMEHEVSTAKFLRVNAENELEQVQKDLAFPLIVKAVDLQGSRGISIAHNREELFAGYRDAMKQTKKDFCIVEEYLEGYEFGAQAFVFDNEILYVLPCGDITYLGKTNIPVGHYAPLEFDKTLWDEVSVQSVNAIKALGLNNCAVNIDFLLKDGKIYLIELTGRVGANCLPQLSSIYFGIDVYKLIIDAALGKNPKPYFEENKKSPTFCYAKMLYSEKTGTLRKIINNNEKNDNIYELSFFVSEGDKIYRFNHSKDCIGEVVVKGKTFKECEALIEDVINHIEFVIEEQ